MIFNRTKVQKICLKDMAFCLFLESLVINMVKTVMDTATKTGIDA